eukprot:8791001-Pyramimonas_sp.AAC.1
MRSRVARRRSRPQRGTWAEGALHAHGLQRARELAMRQLERESAVEASGHWADQAPCHQDALDT